jgi:uncharacterized protein (DUF1501 family)
MSSRRDFLKSALHGSTLLALAPTVPGFLARTARAARPERDGRILVVLQLDGGNDGINTVVPFTDEGYAKHRKLLRLPSNQLLEINEAAALHPALGEAAKLLESDRLAILSGVGYPNPSRSHFESMAIWHSARVAAAARNGLGWLGRALDGAGSLPAGTPAAVFVGPGLLPDALPGRRSVAVSLTRPDDLVVPPGMPFREAAAVPIPGQDLAAFVQRSALDAYAAADRMAAAAGTRDGDARYPATELAGQLRLMARLIKAGFGTRVYYAKQAGYDTHSGQFAAHAALLAEWAGALRAFLDDLAAAGLAERVAVLTFSEFGRTVRENGSAGTDHGTAGPVFLAGPHVKSGLCGPLPSLLDLDPVHGDLKVALDFRRVYATVLVDWLRLPAQAALGGEFERLPLFRA